MFFTVYLVESFVILIRSQILIQVSLCIAIYHFSYIVIITYIAVVILYLYYLMIFEGVYSYSSIDILAAKCVKSKASFP